MNFDPRWSPAESGETTESTPPEPPVAETNTPETPSPRSPAAADAPAGDDTGDQPCARSGARPLVRLAFEDLVRDSEPRRRQARIAAHYVDREGF